MQRAVLAFQTGPGNRDRAALDRKLVEAIRINHPKDLVFAEAPISRKLRKIGFRHIRVQKKGREAVQKIAEYLKLFSFDDIIFLSSEDVIEEHQQLFRFYGVHFWVSPDSKEVSRDTLGRKIKKFLMGYTKPKKERRKIFRFI